MSAKAIRRCPGGVGAARRMTWIACAMLACRLASAAGQSAAVEGAPQKTSPIKTIKLEKVDVFPIILESCPAQKRRDFLGSIKFLGDGVVGFDYGAIADCLGRMTRDDVSNRLAKVGHDGKTDAKDGPNAEFGELFTACSASVRAAFYDGLTLRDGHVLGLYTGGINKCAGKTDLKRFLSLFGVEGISESEFKNGCACQQLGVCVPKSNYSCHSENCRCFSAP
jgi:hypothetical protein